MRANIDRAPGVRLITDHPSQYTAPAAPAVELPEFTPPEGLKVWATRSTNGLHVQGLVDGAGCTYVSLAFAGQYETIEFPASVALDAFEHPFAHGFTIAI